MKKFITSSVIVLAAFAAQACSDPNVTDVRAQVWVGEIDYGVWSGGELLKMGCQSHSDCWNGGKRALTAGGQNADFQYADGRYMCAVLTEASAVLNGPEIKVCIPGCVVETVTTPCGPGCSQNNDIQSCGPGFSCVVTTVSGTPQRQCAYICDDNRCLQGEGYSVCQYTKDCAYCNDGVCSGQEERETCGTYLDCKPNQDPVTDNPTPCEDSSCPPPTGGEATVKVCYPLAGINAYAAAAPSKTVYGSVSWQNSYQEGSGDDGKFLEPDSLGCFTVHAMDVHQGFWTDLMKCADPVNECWGSTLFTKPTSCSVDGVAGTIGDYQGDLGWPCTMTSGAWWTP